MTGPLIRADGRGVPFSLEYDSSRWLPVPNAGGERDEIRTWAGELGSTYTVQAPWDAEPAASLLPRHLEDQYDELDPDRAAALWYCPYGLPAAAYAQIFALEVGDGDVDLRGEVALLPSAVPVRPTDVSTTALGTGVAYSRILVDAEGNPSVAELGYLFAPGEGMIAIMARSSDAEVIGLMAPDLLELVRAIRFEES